MQYEWRDGSDEHAGSSILKPIGIGMCLRLMRQEVKNYPDIDCECIPIFDGKKSIFYFSTPYGSHPIEISGLEELQNSGEAIIDLFEARSSHVLRCIQEAMIERNKNIVEQL